MKSFILSLFSENGDISSMRVMAVLALLMAGTIAILGLYKTSDLTGLSMLVGAFLASAFGGKVAQRAYEVEGNKQKTTEISSENETNREKE